MFEKVTLGPKAPEIVHVVIEIPARSQNKYEFDEVMEVLKLDRVLHSPLFYATDYGFIPETRSEDGDHLDALVLSTMPLFPGCVADVRVVGLLKMEDDKGIDPKIIGVVATDPRWEHVKTFEDIPPHLPKEIQHFFETYKDLENKEVKVAGWGSRDEALAMVRENNERWKKEAK